MGGIAVTTLTTKVHSSAGKAVTRSSQEAVRKSGIRESAKAPSNRRNPRKLNFSHKN